MATTAPCTDPPLWRCCWAVVTATVVARTRVRRSIYDARFTDMVVQNLQAARAPSPSECGIAAKLASIRRRPTTEQFSLLSL
jgi:hypothetical protein